MGGVKRNEYMWYCPDKDCRTLVLKTAKPFIMDGNFKCFGCGKLFNDQQLMKSNLRNLSQYMRENS